MEISLNFFDKVSERYNDFDDQRFLVASSVTAPLAFKLLKLKPDYFTALTLINPVFEFKTKISGVQKASLFLQKTFNSKKPYDALNGLFEKQNNDREMKISQNSVLNLLTMQSEMLEDAKKLSTP